MELGSKNIVVRQCVDDCKIDSDVRYSMNNSVVKDVIDKVIV